MDKLHDCYVAFGRSEITLAEMESEMVASGYGDENGKAMWTVFLEDSMKHHVAKDLARIPNFSGHGLHSGPRGGVYRYSSTGQSKIYL